MSSEKRKNTTLKDIASVVNQYGDYVIAYNHYPEMPDKVIALMSVGGTGAIATHDSRRAYPQPSVQVIVRSNDPSTDVDMDPEEALNILTDIVETLGTVTNQTLRDTFYLSITANADPAPLQRDHANRPAFTATFSILRREHALTS